MTTDIGTHPRIGPERQLPAHVPARSRFRPLRVLLGMLLLVVLAVGIAMFVRHREHAHTAAPPPPPVGVTMATATKGDIAVHLQAIGTVTPVYTASITSQVTGLVVAVHYTEGQRVNKGDPLVDIDPRPFLATLLQAQGALERDQNLLAQAKMDLERYRAAWARNAIAKQTLDDQEKLVLQDQGTVKNDQGTVQYDQVQVDFCHITSPIVGRVGLRLVNPGNVVQTASSTVLAVVTQLEPITVVFTISEDNLSAVRKQLGQGAQLAVDAFNRAAQRKLASGTLLTLDDQIDTTTGTVKARAQFANADDALFPNQFVNARLLVETRHGVTLIPASAVQQNGSQSYVYVIQDGVAHMKQIKTSVTDEGMTDVEGIDPGDVVADSSFAKLHEGVKVTSAPPPAPSGSAAPGSSSTPAPPGGSAAP